MSGFEMERVGPSTPPNDVTEAHEADIPRVFWKGEVWIKRVIALGVFLAAAVLLFARLGHYALWDDEAVTALPALGVWLTGDTTGVVGENIVGYRNGALLAGLRMRRTPPLRFYLAAPSLGLLGSTAFAARLPFALCGLASTAVILFGLKRAHADLTTWILMAEALLGNVSFFLYCRQCRYYSLGILATSALALLYVFWDGRRRSLLAFALLSVFLMSASYANYLSFYACLGADYLIWGRKRRRLAAGDWLWLIVPQVLLATPMVLVWFPLGGPPPEYQTTNWLAEKATMFWWNWRELNQCEFGAVILILLAPLIYARTRWDWLVRLPLAVFIYVAVITLTSAHPLGLTSIADVRYLSPLIPLCMTISVLCLREIAPKPIPAALLGMVVFGTNLLHGGPMLDCGLRSTIVSYVEELARPPGDPYTTAARWINDNVPSGCSIVVRPPHMVYPLMFHAPRAIYAWQFHVPPAPQFEGLPLIHYDGIESPDFFVLFGPFAPDLALQLESPRHGKVRYEHAAVLDTYWKDMFRPELTWHTFRPIPVRDPATEAIHVFRRVIPPIIPRRRPVGQRHRQGSRISGAPGQPSEERLDSRMAFSPGAGVEPAVDAAAAFGHNNFGKFLYAQGRYGEAAAHFTEALRLNPDDPDIHSDFGTVLLRQGRYAEALSHFAEAIRLRPDDPNAYNESAMIMAACH